MSFFEVIRKYTCVEGPIDDIRLTWANYVTNWFKFFYKYCIEIFGFILQRANSFFNAITMNSSEWKKVRLVDMSHVIKMIVYTSNRTLRLQSIHCPVRAMDGKGSEYRKGKIQLAERMANMTFSVMSKSCDKLLIGKTYWKSVGCWVRRLWWCGRGMRGNSCKE